MTLKIGDIRMFKTFQGPRPIVVTNLEDPKLTFKYQGATVSQMYPDINRNVPGIYPRMHDTSDLRVPSSMSLWLFNESETKKIRIKEG
jgi:hypothetical protein